MRTLATRLFMFLLVAAAALPWSASPARAADEKKADKPKDTAAAPTAVVPQDEAATQHAGQLAAATAEYTKAANAARVESDKKLAAAKATYDEATKKARDAYVKVLEKDIEREVKAGNQAGADAIRQKIDYLVNGPPRNEAQKLWAASFAAEANKDYEAAIESLTKMAESTNSTKNAFVQMRFGWLHYLDEDHEAAIESYKNSILVGPRAVSSRLGLLNCYIALNRIDEAIDTAHGILKLDPMHYRANKTLGDLYYVKEDFARAGAHYQRLTVAYPEDLAIATSLGWCYVKLEEKDLALQIFSNVLAVQPDSAAAISGYAAASAGKQESAKTGQEESAKDKIVIRNPVTADKPVRYTLNGQYPVTLKPGSAQTLEPSRTWTIRFDQSAKGNPVQHRLEPGHYEFSSDKARTKLTRR